MAYIPKLRNYLEAHEERLPLSGRLALESGIRGYEAHWQWSRDAQAAYRKRHQAAYKNKTTPRGP